MSRRFVEPTPLDAAVAEAQRALTFAPPAEVAALLRAIDVVGGSHLKTAWPHAPAAAYDARGGQLVRLAAALFGRHFHGTTHRRGRLLDAASRGGAADGVLSAEDVRAAARLRADHEAALPALPAAYIATAACLAYGAGLSDRGREDLRAKVAKILGARGLPLPDGADADGPDGDVAAAESTFRRVLPAAAVERFGLSAVQQRFGRRYWAAAAAAATTLWYDGGAVPAIIDPTMTVARAWLPRVERCITIGLDEADRMAPRDLKALVDRLRRTGSLLALVDDSDCGFGEAAHGRPAPLAGAAGFYAAGPSPSLLSALTEAAAEAWGEEERRRPAADVAASASASRPDAALAPVAEPPMGFRVALFVRAVRADAWWPLQPGIVPIIAGLAPPAAMVPGSEGAAADAEVLGPLPPPLPAPPAKAESIIRPQVDRGACAMVARGEDPKATLPRHPAAKSAHGASKSSPSPDSAALAAAGAAAGAADGNKSHALHGTAPMVEASSDVRPVALAACFGALLPATAAALDAGTAAVARAAADRAAFESRLLAAATRAEADRARDALAQAEAEQCGVQASEVLPIGVLTAAAAPIASMALACFACEVLLRADAAAAAPTARQAAAGQLAPPAFAPFLDGIVNAVRMALRVTPGLHRRSTLFEQPSAATQRGHAVVGQRLQLPSGAAAAAAYGGGAKKPSDSATGAPATRAELLAELEGDCAVVAEEVSKRYLAEAGARFGADATAVAAFRLARTVPAAGGTLALGVAPDVAAAAAHEVLLGAAGLASQPPPMTVGQLRQRADLHVLLLRSTATAVDAAPTLDAAGHLGRDGDRAGVSGFSGWAQRAGEAADRLPELVAQARTLQVAACVAASAHPNAAAVAQSYHDQTAGAGGHGKAKVPSFDLRGTDASRAAVEAVDAGAVTLESTAAAGLVDTLGAAIAAAATAVRQLPKLRAGLLPSMQSARAGDAEEMVAEARAIRAAAAQGAAAAKLAGRAEALARRHLDWRRNEAGQSAQAVRGGGYGSAPSAATVDYEVSAVKRLCLPAGWVPQGTTDIY